MIDFFKEHGFTYAETNEGILEARFNSDDGCYLADGLGIDPDFDELLVQYDTESNKACIMVDGDFDTVELDDLVAALEGDY